MKASRWSHRVSRIWKFAKGFYWPFLFPIFVHLFHCEYLRQEYSQITAGDVIPFGAIYPSGGGQVDLYGTFGNVFDPKAKNQVKDCHNNSRNNQDN